ncbi:Nitrogen regulation protein C [Anaerohalosphaera lusitana]|uniref:Nitrogen regulation protein C n=1 Tax=Anaerohalosphaera lusitana TaxID=1936003 RepID=A0A1U9NQD5_9BACT|nr:response regulator transcription factor [Anaerohalosphaera lusitana]AQT70142.1 Nitrogen regulation protein C [Anaerohalosphaera lusitana]
MGIRILIADDHGIVRQGIKEIVSQHEDMEVIGEAADGLTTLKLVRDLKPDIVLMDISMPDLNGVETTREIKRDYPDVKIIGLSMHSAKKFISEMLKAGASGYLLKDTGFEELINAITVVSSGQNYLSPAITETVVENYVRNSPERPNSVFSTLTKRERQILQSLAEGKTTKQTAKDLFISPKTVEAHRLNVMNKLGIDNVAMLTKYAIQEGLTSPEP